ncbi:MAG: DUF4942 domain-containing protein, partial [Sphingopyxis terrae]
HRAHALKLFDQAHAALVAANDVMASARRAAAAASPGVNEFNYHGEQVKAAFIGGMQLPDLDSFRDTARRVVDTDVWAYLVKLTDLERLMDRKAKGDLRKQLIDNPPEATEDNIVATLQQFALDADLIWRRGVAFAFSSLDRRFRSHDGWKIGNRVILNHAFDVYGRWSYYRCQQETLLDIERAFFVIEGRAMPPAYVGVVGAIDRARQGRWDPHQTELETQYFRVRCFKNGNLHLWFKRADLVIRVNKILAEYYGEVIPEERAPDKDTGLNDPKTTPARYFGFYPTPDEAAELTMKSVPQFHRMSDPQLSVLEPSAGTGNLARRLAARGAAVDCIEIQPALAAQLRASGLYRAVTTCDFLAVQPDQERLYDRVVMNPPFDRERDIDHVMHALKFLKPDGCLTAIMSAGTEFRETRKSVAFRELMASMNAEWQDLPRGSFSEVGTNVNALIVTVWKNGRRRGYY